jgi:hypothetical protein
MAGSVAERQENGVVSAITKAVKQNKGNAITVCAGKTEIEGVIKAEKYKGRQESGSEPYTDVVLHTTFKSKPIINLSLKGDSAPSLAGGGLRGIETIIPGLASRFMREAHKHLISKVKLKQGDKVPDIYGKISQGNKLKLVIGNKAMGGPIDYMYIGGMEPKSKYEPKTNKLIFSNANLIDATTFAKTHELYFRLRARREDQRFDKEANVNGVPKIYGVSPSRGDSAGRIVVTDGASRNAEIVRL